MLKGMASNPLLENLCLVMPAIPSICYWTSPVDTAAVFLPILATMVAISCYSLITGNIITPGWCCNASTLVISTSCLALLTMVVVSKMYTHVMVKILSKLPDDLSSDPLHNVSLFLQIIVKILNFYVLALFSGAEHIE